MKTKSWLCLSGALALLLVTSPLIPSFTGVVLAQSGSGQHQDNWGNALGLTPTQKSQIKSIRQSARQQSDAILTSDQKNALKTARASHTKPQLNLTPDQKTQLQAIRKSTYTKINALLTPTQRQKLATLRQNHQDGGDQGDQ